MVCALVANAASKLVYPHGVYHTLSHRYMAGPKAGPGPKTGDGPAKAPAGGRSH